MRHTEAACRVPQVGAERADAWFAASTSRGDTLGVADGVEAPATIRVAWTCCCIGPICDVQEVRHPVLASCHTGLLSLDRRTGTVTATSIGGCGFLVVRKGQIVARSIAGKLQVSTCPTSLPFLGVGTFLYGDINRPAAQQFRAQSEDMLLLATDGFFDNVDDGCVLSLMNELAGGTDPRRMHLYAETLALMARAARPKETRHKKMDDITVVLAVVN
ncbi:protein phosphatase PTC7 homolog fig-like [Drosophila obscura]|uniref:protein phosphatase PTC7 homolog fig-like n=1 Tax=Drosophila obscura TaxID=7282 RepID=UPI001BB20C98|nr:protein phosphatase PTC7 homolog fig-like [Drosophila obscura]